jgi:uncharacterized protein (TIGR02996 family)
MTEREAFIAAILAAPDDDLPRLVYADWLEEQGEVERAEFIRVQCELAKPERCLTPNITTWNDGERSSWTPCSRLRPRVKRDCLPWCAECQRRADLWTRERDLWAAACNQFAAGQFDYIGLSDHPTEVPGTLGLVRRGFVSDVRCRLADWCGEDPCCRCQGTGAMYDDANWDDTGRWLGGYPPEDCPTCDGTGHTPGVGPRLVREHPFERVVLTDRDPHWNGYGCGWFYDGRDRPSDGVPAAAQIPPDVWHALPSADGSRIVTGRFKSYPTRDAALAALSAALIAWAKAQPVVVPVPA